MSFKTNVKINDTIDWNPVILLNFQNTDGDLWLCNEDGVSGVCTGFKLKSQKRKIMFSNDGSPVLFRIAGKDEEFGVITVAGLGKFNKPFGETKTKRKLKLVFAVSILATTFLQLINNT